MVLNRRESTPTPSPEGAGRGALPRLARFSSVGFLTVVAVVLSASLPQSAHARRLEPRGKLVLESPDRGGYTASPAAVVDTSLSAPAQRRLAADISHYWGGTYTASTGERVEIRASDSYAVDEAANQRWANFLSTLVHGPELSTVTVYLAPLDEVQSICGQSALACYGAQRNLLVAPGEDVADVAAESIVMHEYGHHVAANRSNPPWLTVAFGTKRWASYLQVCARTASAELSPGDESVNYELNPGEGFAEVYRVLNERRLGLPESAWDVVDRLFYPDETALQLLEQDVIDPWSGNATATLRGSFARRGTSRRAFSTSTPYDGATRVTLSAPPRSTLALDVLSPAGKRIARSVTRPGSERRALSFTVCGSRSLSLQVTRVRGGGGFSLDVSRP